MRASPSVRMDPSVGYGLRGWGTLPRTRDGRATGTMAPAGVWKYSVTAPYLQEDLS